MDLRSELGHYLGSETAAAGLVLAWFGGACLFCSALLGLLSMGSNDSIFADSRLFAAPAWGLIALALGLLSRKRRIGPALKVAIWLWARPLIPVAISASFN